MRQIREKLIELRNKLKNLGKNFATINDVTGAYKGLIQLQMTYKLDPVDLHKGFFKYRGNTHYGIKGAISPEDIGNLAFHAFDMNYYDVAADMVKAVYQIGKEEPQKIQVFKKTIDALAKDILSVHNQKLMKYRKKGGESFRSKFT